MPRRTVILIPPSEGKTPGGEGPPWRPGQMAVAGLDERRREVLAAVSAGVVDLEGPTRAAAARYSGVLYKELDAGSLRGAPRRRFERNVLIVSGLWGLVGPGDPLPAYRLKMSARVDGLGRMATWWRPALTAELAERVAGAEVWDLLPNEHAAALDWSVLAPARRTTIRFVDRSDKVVSHWNKLLKGSVVRWLVETGARGPDALHDFEHPRRYELDPATTRITSDRADVVLRER